jgi:hypothetical protein
MPTPTDALAAPAGFEPLRRQLLDAAAAFADDAKPLGDLLTGMVGDVARAAREALEIFPVCHHSPAAAVHLIRRLRLRPPRVIYMEMCEDLRPLLDKLRDCKLPIALQAFAGQSEAFPRAWAPLSVVAPLTEFSAEYQAIAYCLENPSTELVFVDRSVDHIFQWMPQEEGALEAELQKEHPPEGDEDEQAGMHGTALGVQMGRPEPTFELFREFLLRNAQVRHFSEWWDQYVEQPLAGADYATYRHMMFLVGSLIRRLGIKERDRAEDRLRERFMWTRMKRHVKENGLDPRDALHICGAAHSASDVPEFGTENFDTWDVPPRTDTAWLYGLLPSSHAAIDRQFGFPYGTVTLAGASWEKHQRAFGVKPFVLTKSDGKKAKKPVKVRGPAEEETPADSAPAAVGTPEAPLDLLSYLSRPPAQARADEEQLLAWCIGIVGLARRNGYLSTTADAIATYHTAMLLGGLRNRPHPTAYDFRDAAITCLEKDRTPKRRTIAQLCDVLLGGDRIGQVGYASLPLLAQDVHNRLAPLRINLQATTIQRTLLDLRSHPELLPCSDLLWKLRYLLGDRVVRPIMGQRTLGHTPLQESWDVAIGKNQAPLIQLGYEGVTIEQVLEKRLRQKAFAADATTVAALEAAEDCLVYLRSDRLTEELGERATLLLTEETGAQSAPEIFRRVRRLVHHYRATPTGLPVWVKGFVTTGYAHYSTLLPTAFAEESASPDQVAGLLAFLFTLESLALSLGCQRSQLEIAVRQAGTVPVAAEKLGLLWSAEWLLGRRETASIRAFFLDLLGNPLTLSALPAHLNGFVLALQFTPLVAPVVVELVSRAFASLPDRVLMPWLPGLIMMLRQHGEGVLPALLKEAGRSFPGWLADLDAWQPPWEKPAAPAAPPAQPTARRGSAEAEVFGLLKQYPESLNALSGLLGAPAAWPVEASAAGQERQSLEPY